MTEWSPFYCLPRADLTPSGLIQLDTADHEVLLLRRSGVEFRHMGPTPMAPRPRGLPANEHWKNRTGFETVLTITTHRFLLLHHNNNTNNTNNPMPTNHAIDGTTTSIGNSNSNNNNGSNVDARFVHLSNVRDISVTGGPSLMSPNSSHKIVLQTKTYDELVLVFKNRVGISTARNDRDQSFEELRKAMDRKRWEAAARLEEKRVLEASRFNNLGASGHKVGLDRILAKNEARHKQNARLAEEALSGDSETLLGEAAELLRVIQKYTVLVQKFEGNNNNNNSNKNDAEEEAAAKLKGLLSDMGMTSALSQSKLSSATSGGGPSLGFSRSKRSSASAADQRSEYHELTARQVADFLVPRLKATTTGMMSLTDAYCLFNRARGTNLVSPEDLRDACAMLRSIGGLGLSLRTFPSGIRVLQLDERALDDANNKGARRREFLELCGEVGSTALEASHVLKLSPLLAAEQLEEAERLGWLCRDATLSTVRFYPNKFATGF